MTDERAAGEKAAAPKAARRAAGGWRAARWVRRLTQAAAFVFFVYLTFAGLQRLEPLAYASIFFHFDPLAALAAMLSARAWLAPFALAFVTLAVTVLLGRVWCGWICPLGTLLGWLRFRSAARRGARLSPSLRRAKYVLLGATAVMAALGSLALLALDPLALLVRTATTAVVPGVIYAVDAIENAGMRWEPATGAVGWVEEHFRGTLLPMAQPRYEQAVAIFLVLVTIVLLNALAPRFWCRYLCPLGALLALVAKVQVLRPVVGDGCDGCGTCARACSLGAIEVSASGGGRETESVSAAAVPAAVVTSECTECLDCLVACPRREAMSFGLAHRPGPWARYDPGRREVVLAAAAGVGAALLFGTAVARAIPHPRLLRPPGGQNENDFLSRCVRCGECMKVCPTFGLQPALSEAGLEGLWTPVLKPRLGACDYGCSACGQVCPSGAIPKLALEQKHRQVIGVAVIDKDRCLPWASDTPCIVCQEMCPMPHKAIELVGQHLITRPDGTQDYMARPKVVPSLCIGCGICEFKCPLEGTAAIAVRPWTPGLTGASAEEGQAPGAVSPSSQGRQGPA